MQLTQTKTVIDFYNAAIALDNELDFDLFPKKAPPSSESVMIDGIKLPKLGSLTIGESILWDELIPAIDMDKTTMATIYKLVCTIFLRTRASKSLSDIIKMPQSTTEEIYNFFVLERDGEKASEPKAPSEPVESVATGNESAPLKSGIEPFGDFSTATPPIADSVTPSLVAA